MSVPCACRVIAAVGAFDPAPPTLQEIFVAAVDASAVAAIGLAGAQIRDPVRWQKPIDQKIFAISAAILPSLRVIRVRGPAIETTNGRPSSSCLTSLAMADASSKTPPWMIV